MIFFSLLTSPLVPPSMSKKPMPTPEFIEAFEAARIQINNRAYAVDIGEGEDLATWANAEINSGRAHVVIEKLAARADLDQNHRALHILANAHKYRGDEGDLECAETLLERALVLRKDLLVTGDERAATAVASTLSVLGEVAFIRGDLRLADERFLEAIRVQPTYGIAHQCRLCMRSVARDGKGCQQVLSDMDHYHPSWRSDEDLIQLIYDDGMLDWFRAQPHLLNAITQH